MDVGGRVVSAPYMEVGWYDYMEVIGTTPGKEEVEQRQEQLSRVESGIETESNAWSSYRGIL